MDKLFKILDSMKKQNGGNSSLYPVKSDINTNMNLSKYYTGVGSKDYGSNNPLEYGYDYYSNMLNERNIPQKITFNGESNRKYNNNNQYSLDKTIRGWSRFTEPESINNALPNEGFLGTLKAINYGLGAIGNVYQGYKDIVIPSLKQKFQTGGNPFGEIDIKPINDNTLDWNFGQVRTEYKMPVVEKPIETDPAQRTASIFGKKDLDIRNTNNKSQVNNLGLGKYLVANTFNALEGINQVLTTQQTIKDYKKRAIISGNTDNRYMSNNSKNPFGTYTTNQSVGNNFMPNMMTPPQDFGTEGNFAKCGGSMKHYKQGGEYDVSDEELEYIKRNGGQFEIID